MTLPKNHFSFVYKSDKASWPGTKMGAGDTKYKWWIQQGKVMESAPFKTLEGITLWAGNNANPSGFIKKKAGVYPNLVQLQGFSVDGTPDYAGAGKATADTPVADQYTVEWSTDGTVPELILHIEDNYLDAEQAKELGPCKVARIEYKGAEISGIPDALFENITLSILCKRQYAMADSVVISTSKPKFRGIAQRNLIDAGSYPTPYCISPNPIGCTVSWNSETLGPFLRNYAFGWDNPVSAIIEEDGNDYPAFLLNNGRRIPTDVTVELFAQCDHDLDDTIEYCPNLDDSIGTSSDLVVKVPRRHANDFKQYTFENAYLKSFEKKVTTIAGTDVPLLVASFTAYTNFSLVDAQANSSGTATPNDNGDYEL